MKTPLLVALALTSLVACGGPLADGRAQFSKGHYPEAKQTFLQAEESTRGWSQSDRATYALYRGLTHAALGDRAAASAWLAQAKAIEDRAPGALSERDLRRLRIGLEELEMLE